MARLDEKMTHVESKVDEINSKLDHKYVTREEFKPVKQVVFGLVSVILLSVVGAVVALIIRL